MVNLDITKATLSDHAQIPDHVIEGKRMNSPTDPKETEYTCENAFENYGYFYEVGDLKSALIMKAVWNTGKGWEAKSDKTKIILESLDGCGKDSFNDIVFNLNLNMYIFGNSFAEIVRDDEGRLINIIPLNPQDLKWFTDDKGRIIRYEQYDFSLKKTLTTWKPEEIFHLMNNRLGNQPHGISDIPALKKTILADDKSFEDMVKIIKNQAKPFILWKLKTDNQTDIDDFVGKVRRARELGDDMFIPDDENVATYEVIQINPSSILMEWRAETRNRFYRQLGLPLVLFGASGSTESGGKMETFGHQVHWQHGQRYLENQFAQQLGLTDINMIAPDTILNDLQNDQQKDANQGFEIQANDGIAGRGR